MEKTILLVEDTDSWREMLTFILEDEGYKVIGVDGRQAAQEVINQYQIDAVITNLNLHSNSPILDGTGYRLLEYIEQHRPELPRIVLSAIEKPGKVVELYDKYHVKHVSLKDDFSGPGLIQAIHEVLHESKKEPPSSEDTLEIEIIREEIGSLVSNNNLLEAIKKLSSISIYHKDAIMLSQRWHSIFDQHRKQLITAEEANKESNKIASSILELISIQR